MDVVPLIPGLHFLRFPVGHFYLWQDPDGLTLIDAGVPGSARSIADAIRQLGHDLPDVRRLVLTHFHADHVGAAAEIAAWGDVAVLAHHADASVIRGKVAGPPPVLTDWERPLYEQVSKGMTPTPPTPVRVDRELDDGDVVDFGGGARVVAAPGHTAGSIALHLPQRQVLFAGDAVARSQDGRVILGVFNVNRAEAIASFKRLAALDVEVACFGHGEPLVERAAPELWAAADRLSA
jgi:glyoxylase-like metal-dependent hydrolase (beta-lactamase superfamily II)